MSGNRGVSTNDHPWACLTFLHCAFWIRVFTSTPVALVWFFPTVRWNGKHIRYGGGAHVGDSVHWPLLCCLRFYTHSIPSNLVSLFSPHALWRTMGFGSMDLHKKNHCMKLCDQHPKNGKNCYCYKFMRNLSLCIVWYCLILFGIVWNCLVLYGVAPNQTQPKQIWQTCLLGI